MHPPGGRSSRVIRLASDVQDPVDLVVPGPRSAQRSTVRGMKAPGSLLVVSVLLVALSACGSNSTTDDSPDQAVSDSTQTPTEATSATPEEDTATVEQYASIVAKNQDLKKQIGTMSDCDWLGSGALDADPASIVCQAGVLTLSFQAETLSTSLKSAQKPGVPAFIGPPPDEIEPLVADTVSASDALAKSASAANKAGCEQSAAGKCTALRVDVMQAMSDLKRELYAWEPYTG